jgi:hypothetical protein
LPPPGKRGTEVICRDRAGAYAAGEERALVRRTRERYAAVQALRAQGKGIKPIMRELGLAKETVRKFARAASIEELLTRPLAGRPGIPDEHKPYLHERWNAGCTNVLQLHAGITARGYRGSYATVNLYLQPFRTLSAAPPARPAPPKVRDITGWMLRHPDSLGDDEQAKLTKALARCPHLDATAAHVTAFAEMMTGRHGENLDAWIAAVDADDLPDLHSFTTGLKHDHDAVLAGLTLEHSSGAVEGDVNRIKMIKRRSLVMSSRFRRRKEIRSRLHLVTGGLGVFCQSAAEPPDATWEVTEVGGTAYGCEHDVQMLSLGVGEPGGVIAFDAVQVDGDLILPFDQFQVLRIELLTFAVGTELGAPGPLELAT